MAAYDFYSPWFGAAIVNSDGSRFPLWSNAWGGASVRPSDVPEDVPALSYVTDASLEITLGEVPTMSVTLNPPFREGIAFLDSELIEWGASTLELQFGYTGGQSIRSPVYSGIMLQPAISIGAEITITLNAHGTGGFSALRQQGSRTADAGETRRNLIRRIIRGPGQGRDLELDFSDADADDGNRQALDESVQYSQGSKSDWLAAWELTRAADCNMLLVGNTIRVLSTRRRLTADPTRTLRLYDFPKGQLGPSEQGTGGEFPILSFGSNTMAVYLPGAIRATVMRDVSDETRQPVERVMTDASEAHPRTGQGVVEPPETTAMPGLDTGTGDGGEQFPGDPEDPEAARTVSAMRSDYTSMGIQAEIGTVGIPDILPGEVVRVLGVGRRVSGNYAVFKISHSLGSGGFETKLEGRSNVGQLMAGRPGVGPTGRDAEPPPDDTIEVLAQEEFDPNSI